MSEALDVLVAAGKALAVVIAVVVCAYGAWAIVRDQPLNPERSTRSGDTPRHATRNPPPPD